MMKLVIVLSLLLETTALLANPMGFIKVDLWNSTREEEEAKGRTVVSVTQAEQQRRNQLIDNDLGVVGLENAIPKSMYDEHFGDEEVIRLPSGEEKKSSSKKGNSNSKALCEAKFKEAGFEQLDSICSGHHKSWDNSRFFDMKWGKYFSCVGNMLPYKSFRPGFVKDCYSHTLNSHFRSDKVGKCVAKLQGIFDKENEKKKIYTPFRPDACFSTTDSSNVLKKEFMSCYEKIENTTIHINNRFKYCSSYDGKSRVSCYAKAKEHISSQNAWSRCSGQTVKNAVNGGSFKHCMSDLEKVGLSKDQSFGLCATHSAHEVRSCVKRNTDFLPLNVLADNCDEYRFRTNLANKKFKRCVNTAKEDLGDLNVAVDFCNYNDQKLDHVTGRSFRTCVDKVNNLEVDQYLGYYSCSSRSTASLITDPNYISCISKGLKSGIFDYFSLRQTEIRRAFNPQVSNAYHYIFKDCKNSSRGGKYNEYLSVYRDYNIHSDTVFKKAGVKIGGLSAVRFNTQTDELFILSDDRGWHGEPRIYVYDYKFDEDGDLDLTEKDLVTFHKTSVNYTKDKESGVMKASGEMRVSNRYNMDPEGFDFTKDGSILVSSELDDLSGDDYLKLFTPQGKEIENVKVNDLFRPGSLRYDHCDEEDDDERSDEEREFDNDYSVQQIEDAQRQGVDNGAFRRPENPNYAYSTGSGNWEGNRSSNGSSSNSRGGSKKSCYSTYEDRGLQMNKSFESLTISPDKNFLFTANEAAVDQDLRWVKIKQKKHGKRSSKSIEAENRVRIVKYVAEGSNFKEVSQHFYDLELSKDNGLVEMVALSEDVLLTLERRWDDVKRKITSRIFIVNLKGAKDVTNYTVEEMEDAEPVKKELVLDLDDIKYDLSSGFRRLDNFEGLTIGPKLPNGKDSLVLVSDNNFSLDQRSMILVLEADIAQLLRKGQEIK